ncbi:hypothetical protein BJ165DRAFT_1118664 [Panaeolus papilionaceus]|nr:hypothetical protein BJ165DRAFT_1118664 [Panaeolus papilionaceus]
MHPIPFPYRFRRAIESLYVTLSHSIRRSYNSFLSLFTFHYWVSLKSHSVAKALNKLNVWRCSLFYVCKRRRHCLNNLTLSPSYHDNWDIFISTTSADKPLFPPHIHFSVASCNLRVMPSSHGNQRGSFVLSLAGHHISAFFVTQKLI